MEANSEIFENLPKTRAILCCECGLQIEPNPANMCVTCLRTHVDITAGVPKQGTLYFCRGCERYLQPPSEWIRCSLESRELLGLCLKKLRGLNRLQLVDASFVWTEPHSKRIKVKLAVRGEVLGGTVLEQVFIVEFTINHQMCTDCHRTEAQDFWRALVQVRQKAENKKTFYYLEQLILKHKAHENTVGIKPSADGLDFFYSTEGHARKMIDFLQSVLPCKSQHSKKLISHDIHSNIYNYKFTYCVDLVPISKDSVVCLPKKFTQQMGGISPLCLVYRVTNTIHLIDPTTSQTAEVNSNLYWRNQFSSICNPKQLVEYIVMDIEPVLYKDQVRFPGQGNISNKHMLADVWLVKASEMGINDNYVHSKSHLGHILKVGDSVLGYNVKDSNVNDPTFDKLDKDKIPDIILVKKYCSGRSQRRRQRIWKLKHLANEMTTFDTETKDYNEFLDDLEEDPELRQNVNIYKDSTKQIPVDMYDNNFEDGVGVTLQEMLDDLVIDDVDMDDASES